MYLQTLCSQRLNLIQSHNKLIFLFYDKPQYVHMQIKNLYQILSLSQHWQPSISVALTTLQGDKYKQKSYFKFCQLYRAMQLTVTQLHKILLLP